MFYPWLIHIFPCVLPCVYPLKVVFFGCLMSYQRVTSPQVQHTGGIGVLRGQPSHRRFFREIRQAVRVFFFFRVHVSICFLHSEKGISMDILSFFCHKIRRSEITMVFFQRSQVSTPFLGTCWIFHGLSKAGPLEEEARSIFRSELAFGYVKQFANWKMAIVDFPISMVDLSSSLCKRLPEGKYIRHRKCLVI